MIKVKYNPEETKDAIESIIGKNFFLFANEVVLNVLLSLKKPTRLMNDLTVTVYPHKESIMGGVSGYKIRIYIQDTEEEIKKTLIHETVHTLNPSMEEDEVESLTQEMYNLEEPETIEV